MAIKRQRIRNEGQGDATAFRDAPAERLEHLRRVFAKFRREHRPRARIARTLREAALEAIQSGISEHSVRRACRISREQLDWWRRSENKNEQQLEKPEQKARIFPVVDDSRETSGEGDVEAGASDLHLRMGRWEISIRQVES